MENDYIKLIIFSGLIVLFWIFMLIGKPTSDLVISGAFAWLLTDRIFQKWFK